MKAHEKIALGIAALLVLSPPKTPRNLPGVPPRPTSKGPRPSTSAPAGDNDVIQYQVDASTGLILVATDAEVSWGYPKLKEDKLSPFRAMVLRWSDLVDSLGHDFNIPSSSIFGIMWAESQGNPNAKSKAGALGLMQVMPSNFPQGTQPSAMLDPRTNMSASVKLLRAASGRPLPEMASWYNAGGRDGAPWTNEAWLKAGRTPLDVSRWGVACEPGYIDRVVAASNTYILMQQGQV